MRGTTPPIPRTFSWRAGYVFMAWYLIKHGEDFAFTFTVIIASL